MFIFRALNLKRRAEAELRELEHRLSFEARINISIDSTSREHPMAEGYLISAIVEVENVGSRSTAIYYSENRSPFSATEIEINKSGAINLKERTEVGVPYGDSTDTLSRGAILRPGAKVELPFIVWVAAPGVYLLSFSAFPKVEEVEEIAIALNIPEEYSATLVWSGRAYTIVGGLSTQMDRPPPHDKNALFNQSFKPSPKSDVA